MMAGKDITVY